MANAKTRDARAGFAIFLQHQGNIELEAINMRLEKSGYGPVSPRMVTHYRNLVRAGFNRYISINRFDVARASRAYENMSSLGRYRYRSVSQPVNMIFMKNDRLFQTQGLMVEVSDVGAVIEISENAALDELRTFRPAYRDAVILHHEDRSDAIKGRLMEVDLERSPAIVEVEHSSLTSIADIDNANLLSTRLFRFTLVSEQDSEITFDVLGRRLHHFFDILEGLRSLLNEAGRYSDQYTYAPPPVIEEVRLSSPAHLALQIAPELVSLVSWPLIGGILIASLRKQWHQATLSKKQGRLADVELEIRQLELDSKRQEAELRAAVIDNVRNQLPESTISDDQMGKIIDAYVLPSSRALGRAEVQAIDIQPSETSDVKHENDEADSYGDSHKGYS